MRLHCHSLVGVLLFLHKEQHPHQFFTVFTGLRSIPNDVTEVMLKRKWISFNDEKQLVINASEIFENNSEAFLNFQSKRKGNKQCIRRDSVLSMMIHNASKKMDEQHEVVLKNQNGLLEIGQKLSSTASGIDLKIDSIRTLLNNQQHQQQVILHNQQEMRNLQNQVIKNQLIMSKNQQYLQNQMNVLQSMVHKWNITVGDKKYDCQVSLKELSKHSLETDCQQFSHQIAEQTAKDSKKQDGPQHLEIHVGGSILNLLDQQTFEKALEQKSLIHNTASLFLWKKKVTGYEDWNGVISLEEEERYKDWKDWKVGEQFACTKWMDEPQREMMFTLTDEAEKCFRIQLGQEICVPTAGLNALALLLCTLHDIDLSSELMISLIQRWERGLSVTELREMNSALIFNVVYLSQLQLTQPRKAGITLKNTYSTIEVVMPSDHEGSIPLVNDAEEIEKGWTDTNIYDFIQDLASRRFKFSGIYLFAIKSEDWDHCFMMVTNEQAVNKMVQSKHRETAADWMICSFDLGSKDKKDDIKKFLHRDKNFLAWPRDYNTDELYLFCDHFQIGKVPPKILWCYEMKMVENKSQLNHQWKFGLGQEVMACYSKRDLHNPTTASVGYEQLSKCQDKRQYFLYLGEIIEFEKYEDGFYYLVQWKSRRLGYQGQNLIKEDCIIDPMSLFKMTSAEVLKESEGVWKSGARKRKRDKLPKEKRTNNKRSRRNNQR